MERPVCPLRDRVKVTDKDKDRVRVRVRVRRIELTEDSAAASMWRRTRRPLLGRRLVTMRASVTVRVRFGLGLGSGLGSGLGLGLGRGLGIARVGPRLWVGRHVWKEG